jgi:hypothetical protein
MMEEIARDTPGIVRVLDDVPPVHFPIWLVTHPPRTADFAADSGGVRGSGTGVGVRPKSALQRLRSSTAESRIHGLGHFAVIGKLGWPGSSQGGASGEFVPRR